MASLKVPVSPRDHSEGAADAPLTLVEYGDYECPYCAAAHPVVQAVRRHFGERLRFAYRHFPLTEIHPHAAMAAETAEFAGDHGRFWRMHDGLFANSRWLNVLTFIALANALGLSEAELRHALATGAHEDKIQSDFVGGVRSGVNGTPTFFINGERYDGPPEFNELTGAISLQLLNLEPRAR